MECWKYMLRFATSLKLQKLVSNDDDSLRLGWILWHFFISCNSKEFTLPMHWKVEVINFLQAPWKITKITRILPENLYWLWKITNSGPKKVGQCKLNSWDFFDLSCIWCHLNVFGGPLMWSIVSKYVLVLN